MSDNFAPDVGMLSIHYGRNRLMGADGCVHTRHDDGEPAKKSYRLESEIERERREAKICLECNRKECRGDCMHFQRKKKEVKKHD